MTLNRFDLTGRNALITGGGTGIGQQCATVLAEAGAGVVLCARRVDTLEQAVAKLEQEGHRASCVPMDITDEQQVKAGFDAINDESIDIIVNNAGAASTPLLLDLPEEDWDRVVDTNLKGAWLVAREGSRRMIEAGIAGSVINISSILGTTVQKGTGAYAASKAAMGQMTRVMAVEWARYNIRVNAIAPGYIDTDLASDFLESEFARKMIKRIPQRRLGGLEDLSGAVLLLASDAGAYITGTTITVDGGHSVALI